MKRWMSLFLSVIMIVIMLPVSSITANVAINSKVVKAVNWAIAIASDNTHGDSQSNRNGPATKSAVVKFQDDKMLNANDGGVSPESVITAKTARTTTMTAKFIYNGTTYSKTCTVMVVPNVLLGDVNGDGAIDAANAGVISLYDAGFIIKLS